MAGRTIVVLGARNLGGAILDLSTGAHALRETGGAPGERWVP